MHHDPAPESGVSPPAIPPKAPLLYKISSVCQRLDCSRTTVWRMVREGSLRSVTLNKRAVRIIAADVDALLHQPAAH